MCEKEKNQGPKENHYFKLLLLKVIVHAVGTWGSLSFAHTASVFCLSHMTYYNVSLFIEQKLIVDCI